MSIVSTEEIARQRALAGELRGRFAGQAYHIVTYGCQMNAHESEAMAGWFEAMGMAPAETRWQADVLVFNTCCIRENAEKRLFGNIGKLREHKAAKRPDLLIGVAGCVTQQEGVAERLMRRYPFVDFTMGTNGLHVLPEMLQKALRARAMRTQEDERIAEGIPVRRAREHAAYVSIMYGCDNYCSYCVVPYVRGRERSRDARAIVTEAEALARDGVREITLLGQNVNSFSGGMSFAALLRELDGVVPRIRFMTSHPKDLSQEVIRAMADCRSVCPHLHLPVQSGSDRILAAMNRKYDTAAYRKVIRAAREAIPGLGVTTDFIVGFPGEEEEDFRRTLDFAAEMRYDAAFTFAYSARRGTRAAAMEGHLAESVKDERLQRLIAVQEGVQQGLYQALLGTRHEALIEGPSKRGNGVTGRVGRGITVNMAGARETGAIVPVIITQAKQKTLMAAWEDDNR